MLELAQAFCLLTASASWLLLLSFVLRVAFLWIVSPSIWERILRLPFLLVLKAMLYFCIAAMIFPGRSTLSFILVVALWFLFQGAELKEHLHWRTTSSYSASDRKTQVIFNWGIFLIPIMLAGAFLLSFSFNLNGILGALSKVIENKLFFELFWYGIGLGIWAHLFLLTLKYRGMIAHLLLQARRPWNTPELEARPVSSVK